MSAPVLALSETYGSAATVNDTPSGISYDSAGGASTSSSALNNPVTAGANSFERYNRFKVTTPAPNSITGLTFYYGTVTDGNNSTATVPVKYGANAAYATPVVATSTVATLATTANQTAPGASLTAPANTAGSYSGYIASQFQPTAAAIDNITFSTPFLTAAYFWS